MNADQARAFCDRWLPAWTGGDPQRLIQFYSDDVFYSDPARPGGVVGRAALANYFSRLLSRYPEWVWRHDRGLELKDGFVNFWTCQPAPHDPPFNGVCIVLVKEGLISRNEVFFDPAPLLGSGAATSTQQPGQAQE